MGRTGLPKARGRVSTSSNNRRAPTVLNAALQSRLTGAGIARGVEDQAGRALTGPASFGNPDKQAPWQSEGVPGYIELFQKAFPAEPDPVTIGN